MKRARLRAPIEDAVALPQAPAFAADHSSDLSRDHEQQLLGVAVAVGLVAGGSARRKRPREHLDVGSGDGRQLVLSQRADRNLRPAVVADDGRATLIGGTEKIAELYAKRRCDPLQRLQRSSDSPALELAQEALGDSGPLGGRLERQAPGESQLPKHLPDWSTGCLLLGRRTVSSARRFVGDDVA